MSKKIEEPKLGHIVQMPDKLFNKIMKIQEDMKVALDQAQAPYYAAINNLIDGFLMDKDSPESGKIQIDYKTKSLKWESDDQTFETISE